MPVTRDQANDLPGPARTSEVRAAFADYEPYGIVPDDWWDQLRQARRACPVAHSDRSGGFWLVTRAVDVAAILQAPRKFSSADGLTIQRHPDSPVQPPLEVDPPVHTDFRRLLNPYFAAPAVEAHSAQAAGLARQLIARFAANGECELLDAYARPLAAMVLGRFVLGLTDLAELLELQRQVTVIASQNTADDAQAAWLALRGYAEAMLQGAARRPPEDGIPSALVHGRIVGRPVTREEQVGTLVVSILGGLGTTADAISRIMIRLTDDPSLEARLRAPGWVSRDLDEFLRLDCPVQWTARTVMDSVELGGVMLRPGDRVMVHIGSANRDDTAFDHPDRLDFERIGNRPLAFGLGPHHCVGIHLARMVIRVAFEELLARFTGFDRDRSMPLAVYDGPAQPLPALPVTFRLRLPAALETPGHGP